MLTRKHNRTLLIFVVVVLLILGWVLFREGKLKDVTDPANSPSSVGAPAETSAGDASLQDQMGDQVKPAPTISEPASEKQKVFAEIRADLLDCLAIRGSNVDDSSPQSLETLLKTIQPDWGPVVHQSDRWMNWQLRTPEGKERRLRLEIIELEDSKVSRELHYYSVDRDGQPMPIDIGDSKSMNPNDEIINQMLKDGEVTEKERAAYVEFGSGERVEYLEDNGDLSEIEVIKAGRSYRCNTLKARESCQCIR